MLFARPSVFGKNLSVLTYLSFTTFILWPLQYTIAFCDRHIWETTHIDKMYPNVCELSQLGRSLIVTSVNTMKILCY